jgi:HPt (histidine-containing phosphotransfer) domain-containing protein
MELVVDRTHLRRGLIEQALSEEEWGEVRAIAHTVKGSGATFGFPEITRLGKEICDALDNGEQNPVPALVQELMQAMAEI